MWSYEYGVETSATREAIWKLWSDVEGWDRWNPDIERIELHGPFATGSEIAMTPRGDETVRLRIADVTENELFVDEAEMEGVLIRTTHRLDEGGEDKLRVVYRMEITGPDADRVGPEIGPAITADFPETIAGLVELAER